MSCLNNCNLCTKLIKTTSVSITGVSPNQVVTYVINPTDLNNLETYCLVFCQSLPTSSAGLQVELSDGTNTYTILNAVGNDLRANKLCTRRRYKAVYGSDPSHFLLTCNNLV